MAESWEQTKKRLNKDLGLKIVKGPVSIPVLRISRPELSVRFYNIHKRSLPPGIDKVVVINVTKEEAEFILNHISEKRKIALLKPRAYQDDSEDSKTLIYYDILPVNAKPNERSIYYNSDTITTESIPGYKTPRRIN